MLVRFRVNDYKEKDQAMASVSMSAYPTLTESAFPEESTPAQGALLSAGAGITGGVFIV